MPKIFKNKKVWIFSTIMVIPIVYFFFTSNNEEIFVDSENVVLRDIIHKVNASGKIQPEEEVQITSTITGWITQITVKEGEEVAPGQHLISIDEKQIRQRYNNANSQVKSSDASLRRVESQLERTRSLYSQSLISKQELEQVEASFRITLSQSEQANANVLSAEDELAKTKLTAPKSGIVTSITKEEGEMAVGGMFNPGVLMTIADLSKMEVEVDVNENDVVKIEVGDKSEIEIDAYPDTTFYGIVSEIAHLALSSNMGMQQQVTNFKVKVRMSSVPDRIRPGMSSTVNIITETIKNTISIPIQSLTSRPENYEDLKKDTQVEEGSEQYLKRVDPVDIVFVLVNTFNDVKAPEGKKFAVIKPIKVGISSENYYSVLSGVNLNDPIVTGGYRLLSKDLFHGDIVSLKNDNN